MENSPDPATKDHTPHVVKSIVQRLKLHDQHLNCYFVFRSRVGHPNIQAAAFARLRRLKMGDHHQEGGGASLGCIHLDVPLVGWAMPVFASVSACTRYVQLSRAAGFKPISLARATAHSFCRKCGCVWTSILLGNSQKVRWGN